MCCWLYDFNCTKSRLLINPLCVYAVRRMQRKLLPHPTEGMNMLDDGNNREGFLIVLVVAIVLTLVVGVLTA